MRESKITWKFTEYSQAVNTIHVVLHDKTVLTDESCKIISKKILNSLITNDHISPIPKTSNK